MYSSQVPGAESEAEGKGYRRALWRAMLVPAAGLVVCAIGASACATADVAAGAGAGDYTVQAQPPAGSCHYRTASDGAVLPDPACTAGATNPRVTQANIADTICRPGYTNAIRPARDITEAEKRANATSYGYSRRLSDAEYDHLIPLALSGDPNDARNLWVEPGNSPNPKDDIEIELARMVCSGRVSLVGAQQAIASDWTTALQRLSQ
jgi:hypothetical protein